MTSEQIRIRYEKNFYDEEYMLKKRASRADLTFRELKIYYAEICDMKTLKNAEKSRGLGMIKVLFVCHGSIHR